MKATIQFEIDVEPYKSETPEQTEKRMFATLEIIKTNVNGILASHSGTYVNSNVTSRELRSIKLDMMGLPCKQFITKFNEAGYYTGWLNGATDTWTTPFLYLHSDTSISCGIVRSDSEYEKMTIDEFIPHVVQ